MRIRAILPAAAAIIGTAAIAFGSPMQTLGNGPVPQLSVLGTYNTGLGETAAEIVAYENGRMYVVNAANNSIDIVSITNPAAPALLKRVSMAPYGSGLNSVDINQGLLVAAVEASPKTTPGKAVFFDADGNFKVAVTVGALPDMVTFTPDGNFVLVANEGEPSDNYTVDPEGSVTIINANAFRGAFSVAGTIAAPASTSAKNAGAAALNVAAAAAWGAAPVARIPATVRTVSFTDFNVGGPRHHELPADVRIFGPNATVAQDLEPEYIAVSADSRTAWVSLQENNAMAIIDIPSGRVTSIAGLGKKNHNLPGNGLDASDQDNAINIANWPVYGLYMPDTIAAYRVNGMDYIITANEGDAREWGNFVEPVRIGNNSYVLDPARFPNAAALKNNQQIGRLNATRYSGDTDGDGDFDEIHVFGARSFSIWNDAGAKVFDSGDQLEQITAAMYPANFNSNNSAANFDSRSDDKGPEPEAVAIGEYAGRFYAFVGLERIGGIMVYDVTNPAAPTFVQYINNRSFGVAAAPDSGPEGMRFVPAHKSPTGMPLLLVANEISGTVTAYSFAP